jgi:hypothetical protein
VEAQEMKLRKLRSLRGGAAGNGSQPPAGVNGNKNNTVLADLESIRGLFNEKEKELSMAVRKVEDLTHQVTILLCFPTCPRFFEKLWTNYCTDIMYIIIKI